MSLTETAFIAGCKAVLCKVGGTYADANSVRITDTRLISILPSRLALNESISDDDVRSWDFHEFYSRSFKENCWSMGWVNSAELTFCVKNTNQKRPLIIHGFYVESSILETSCPASYLQVPQGSVMSGECYRFAVSLDADAPAFQLYELIDHAPKYFDESNYFDFSTINIASNGSANVNLSLISNQRSRSVSCVTMRYSIKEEQMCIDVPLEKSIRIYSLDSISCDQRFRRTWSEEAPAITAESDGSVISPDVRLCRWDNYRGGARQ